MQYYIPLLLNFFEEMMDMSEKQKLLNYITNLDDNLSSNDILYKVLIYFKVQKGLSDIENGNTFTNEEMKEMILKC